MPHSCKCDATGCCHDEATSVEKLQQLIKEIPRESRHSLNANYIFIEAINEVIERFFNETTPGTAD